MAAGFKSPLFVLGYAAIGRPLPCIQIANIADGTATVDYDMSVLSANISTDICEAELCQAE